MSVVKPGDLVAVFRSGKLHHAPADMSTVQDTDLLVIGRGTKPYKCTFADWKASQVPPVSINKPALLTPADGAGQTTQAVSDVITAVGESGSGIAYGDNVYYDFGPYLKGLGVTAVTGFYLDGGAKGYSLGNGAYIAANNTTFPFLIDGVNIKTLGITTTSETGTDYAGFTWAALFGAGANGAQASNDDYSCRFAAVPFTSEFKFRYFAYPGQDLQISVYDQNGTLIPLLGDKQTQLTFASDKDLAGFASGDAVNQDDSAASGTVGSTDATAKTMTLATSTGTWSANTGNWVVGAPKLSTDAAVGETPTFTSTAFAITGTGITHASSDWQVTLKTDTGFASPVVQSMADATNLVSWQGGPLQANTDYIARVRHNGSGGLQSPWSDVIGFKTKSSFSDYVTAPGDLWVAGSAAGTGAFRTNPAKMVSVAWGDKGFALGVDGKLYKAPTLSYANMTVVHTPPSPVTAFGVIYNGSNLIYIDDAGKITLLDAAGTPTLASYSLPGGKKAVGISWVPNRNTAPWFVLDDAGDLWVSNALATASPTAFTHKASPGFFRFACATTEIYGIKADGTLWKLNIDPLTGNGPATPVAVSAGTTFKSVHCGYNATTYAIKSDGTLQRIVDANAVYPAAGPAGVTLKEIALAYYNMFALSDDGRVFVTGVNATPTGPYKGAAPTATTWAEYDLPKPCPGFGTSKYSGSGYDYPLILP